MREWRQRTWAALLGVTLVGGTAVLATQAIGHPENLRALTVGWEQYFDIRWGVARQEWGPKEIDPGSRVYFDVKVPGGAATYEVSILSWEWFWSSSGGGM